MAAVLSQQDFIHHNESEEIKTAGRWTTEEHNLFVEGLKLYQKQWKNIADLVKTRTVVQVRTHAQKYFQKQEKEKHTISVKDDNNDESRKNEMNTSETDDFRMAGTYRTQSVSSVDSFDNHGKYGRSVSLGSESGCTDNDFSNHTSGNSSSSNSFNGGSNKESSAISTSCSTVLSLLRLNSSPRIRAISIADSTGDSPRRSSDVKKRCRESSNKSSASSLSSGLLNTESTPGHARALKSPKRTLHKQTPLAAAMHNRIMQSKFEANPRTCFDFPSLQQARSLTAPYLHIGSQMGDNLPSFSFGGSCGGEGGGGDLDSDMLDLLENIDWPPADGDLLQQPADSSSSSSQSQPYIARSLSVCSDRSGAVPSPFSDSAAPMVSLPLEYHSAHGPVIACASPMHFEGCDTTDSFIAGQDQQLSNSANLSFPQERVCPGGGGCDDELPLDVFEEYFKEDLLRDIGHGGPDCRRSDSNSSLNEASMKILQQNTLMNASSSRNFVPFEPPVVDRLLPPRQHRVQFSSVIDELISKTGGGNNSHSSWASVGDNVPLRNSFLRPTPPPRPKDQFPLSPLPPLSALTSSAPLVISSQSLTLFDSTFSNNFPQVYGEPDAASCSGSGGGDETSSSDCGSSVATGPRDEDLGSYFQYGIPPPAPPIKQSPAVRKRGRPRKSLPQQDSNLIFVVTPTLISGSSGRISGSSRSYSDVSISGMSSLRIVTGQPSFPHVPTAAVRAVSTGDLLAASPAAAERPSRRKHSFDEFLRCAATDSSLQGSAVSSSYCGYESTTPARRPFVGGNEGGSVQMSVAGVNDCDDAVYCDPFQDDEPADLLCRDVVADFSSFQFDISNGANTGGSHQAGEATHGCFDHSRRRGQHEEGQEEEEDLLYDMLGEAFE